MKNFVDNIWLEDKLYGSDIVILDARGELDDPNAGEILFDSGHIPNAQYVSMEEVMSGEKSEHGGRHPLPNIDKFVEDMKGFGVDDDSTVVIYDDGDLTFAGRLLWLLRYIGKDNVFVLKGGYPEWVSSGGEITDSTPSVRKSENLSVNINEDIKRDMDYVRDSIGKDGVVLVDSRSKERFTGENEPKDSKAGRIPSAVNYPQGKLLEMEDFPSEESLKEFYKDLKDSDEIIVYCGSGISATVNYMFMEEAGFEPKLYPGSFSDWISYEENEVESDF